MASFCFVFVFLHKFSYVDPESVVRGGSNFDICFSCFLVDERRDDPNTCTTKRGPSSARQQNAI